MIYSKLRGKIKEVFGTNEKFADKLGIDVSSVSAKLNNKTPWKREEIEKSCEILNIDISEVYLYFFCTKSEKTQFL